MAIDKILVKVPDKSNGITDWNNALSSLWASDSARPWDIYSTDTARYFWDSRYSVEGGSRDKMTPEEVHQELADIKQMLLEVKAAIDRFTSEKQQHWKDEAARRRERGW